MNSDQRPATSDPAPRLVGCLLISHPLRPAIASCLFPVAVTRDNSIVPFLTWLGLAIAIIAVTGVVLLIYRRNVLAHDKGRDAQSRLMDDLRAMRDRGELNPEEYDAAKRALVARLTGSEPPPVRRPVATPADRLARPGYDLTGAPLPKPPDGPPRT